LSTYKTEAEQVEDIKRWAKAYGPAVVIGIILALVLSYAWHYWQSYQNQQQIAASELYEQLQQSEDLKTHSTLIKQLNRQYAQTPYASLAHFLLAKTQVEQQHYQAAEHALQWITTHSKNQDFIAIAKLRLARIDIQTKQYDQGLALLNTIKDPNYDSVIYAIKGDIYHAKHEIPRAKQAYQQALALAPDPNNLPPQLSLKQDNLALTSA